jgi:hypothetical protein
MLGMMKRHEVQVLRRAGVMQGQVAKLTGAFEQCWSDVSGYLATGLGGRAKPASDGRPKTGQRS